VVEAAAAGYTVRKILAVEVGHGFLLLVEVQVESLCLDVELGLAVVVPGDSMFLLHGPGEVVVMKMKVWIEW